MAVTKLLPFGMWCHVAWHMDAKILEIAAASICVMQMSFILHNLTFSDCTITQFCN